MNTAQYENETASPGNAVVPAAGKPKLSLLKGMNPYDPETLRRGGAEPIRLEESRTKAAGAKLLVVGFAAFMAWATLAPIDSGANVMGSVVVMGNRKAVQHPTGGVVETILVREGSVVRRGDLLIRLNPLSLEAALNSAELDYINALAVESRLVSERENLKAIAWLPEFLAYDNAQPGDPRVAEARRQQVQLFESRRAELDGQLRILREQVGGLSLQAAEMEKIIATRHQQLSMLADEARSNRELADEGFVPRSRANEVERSRTDVLASIATTSAELSKAQSGIAATRLQLNQTQAVFRRDLETQLAEAQKLRASLRGKVDSLRFDLSLTELRAPAAGTIVGLKVNTVGGVIPGGDVLMEIVPNDGTLIVEAEVPPTLIDKVRTGLQADMRFTAFNQNTTPVIPGKVALVGADLLTATSKDQPPEYYLAQIETTAEGYALLGSHKVQPGMPVDVVIKTGERSFLSYLAKPLTDRFAKAFKED